MPYFDCTSALENIDPDRAPAIIQEMDSRNENRRLENSLAQRTCIFPKEIVQRIRVSLDVKLHLPLLHDLRQTQLSTARDDKKDVSGILRSWPPGSWVQCQIDVGEHGF